MIKKNDSQVFRDPIYGYITVEYDVIIKLIDSIAFQRLRRIKQLSGVSMVFHGAEHSRFSHSLGTYHNANKFLKIEDLKKLFDERQRLLFLISALLHDIGHGPYSHAFEDVFNVNHEIIGARIILENEEIRSILDSIDDSFADDVAGIILKKNKYQIIEQLISSQLDVDRLDYLVRDAYFTGVSYGKIDIDRLIRTARIRNGKVVFKVSGIHAIENYLISRYHMYWQVYYHNVARSYEVILEKIYLRIKDLIKLGFNFKSDIEMIKKVIENPNNLNYYLKLDDYYINGLFSRFIDEEDEILKELSFDFLNRKIWKYVSVEEKEDFKARKLDFKDELYNKYFTALKNINQSTYKDSNKIGDKIYILLEDGSIKTILEESNIIKSLMDIGEKSDLKFFYKKR